VVLVAVQLSVLGLYLPPVFKEMASTPLPPHSIISLPVPDCCVKHSTGRRVGGAGGRPTVCIGIVFPACVNTAAVTISTPDDHLTAGPNCRVRAPGIRRVGGACGCPTIHVSALATQDAYAGRAPAPPVTLNFTPTLEMRSHPPASSRLARS
jgi:hypothetical protein